LRATSSTQQWTVRLRDTPRAWARVRVGEGGTVYLDAGRTELAPGQPAPIVRYEWESPASNPAPLVLPTGKRITVKAPAVDGVYRVILRVTDAMSRTDMSTVLFRVSGGRAAGIDLEQERPAWLDGTILYGVPLPLLSPFGFE